MADIIELILADHERIRRLLRALDDAARYGEDTGANWVLAPVWRRLAGLLELHADAGEEICYLALFGPGQDAAAQMQDAIADHDDIREAVAEARLHPAGSAAWWRAVTAAQQASSDHIARQERGVLAAFGRRAAPALRTELARQWATFITSRTRDGSARDLLQGPPEAVPGTAVPREATGHQDG
jgi:hypothetical protein